MTIPVKTQLRASQQPRLLNAPDDYTPEHFNQVSNTLRLYFNQLDTLTQALLTNTGGSFLRFPLGSFYDTTSQTAAAMTPAAITLNTTDLSNGVTLSLSSHINVAYSGIYNLQFSIQCANAGAADDNVYVWIKKNGTDIANSASIQAVPSKHGTTDGANILALNLFLNLAAGDYIQLYWMSETGNGHIQTYAAGAAPVYPASPSVIVTMTFVCAPIA